MELILGLATPIVFLLFLLLEHLFPARTLPRVRGWYWKGLVFFIMGAVGSTLLPMAAAALVGAHSLRLGFLGTWLGALIAFVASELVTYFVHRTLHNSSWLWRFTHQMHHSAERMDVLGSSYFHPFDVIALGLPASVVVSLLGVTADAAGLAGFLLFAISTFSHLNVRTPQWVGWLIQRPEGHSLHHARGIHAYNYGLTSLWDLVFGTFRNPLTFHEEQGFYDGASARIGAMLLGKDVSQP